MKIYRTLTLILLWSLTAGCSANDVSDNFNLKMQGITVVYFSEIRNVFLLQDNILFIPLSERDQKSLNNFIGNEGPVELEFYLGEEKFGDFTLTGGTRYEALRIPYEEAYGRILKQGGVALKKRG